MPDQPLDNVQSTDPTYGTIDRYLGAKGEEYFAWQGADALQTVQYNLHLWQPWIAPHDEVLDFGCGGGSLLHSLTARRKAGVEINPHARAVATRLGLDVKADLREVTEQFDKVITSHALEHVPHPRQAVIDLRAKLRNERSRLLVLLPLDDWRNRSQRRYRPNDIHMHLHTWTPQNLGNLLESCDLRVEQIRVVRHAWPPGKKWLWRIHPTVFHSAAFAWSILNKQYQLFAVAALK